MMTQMMQKSQRWQHLQEMIATILFGGIPRKPGILLRRLLYRGLVRMGSGVSIERHVELVGTRQMEFRDNAFLDRNVYICAENPTCHITVGASVSLCDGVRITGSQAHSTIMLHDKSVLDRGVCLSAYEDGWIEIGESTYIGAYSCLAGPNITIGRNCLIASHAGIYANNRNFDDPTRPIEEQGMTCQGIVIEDDCWLGTGVKVLDGVTIGKGSVIGAGAVVTRSIPPYSVAVGVPAKVISHRGSQADGLVLKRDKVYESLIQGGKYVSF